MHVADRPQTMRLMRWLTADEAFVYLGMPSRQALYQAVRRGTVPVHRLGRRQRFDREELDRLLGGERHRAAVP